MDIVGEFLGKDTDTGIWRYFKEHWLEWFPGLGSRVNYAKQSANLWRIKQEIQAAFAEQSGALVDRLHITNRVGRKILSHTVGVIINKLLGNPPLQFERLGIV